MKKAITIIPILMLTLALPVSAQIFNAEDSHVLRSDPEEVLSGVILPKNGELGDQENSIFVPLGEGMLLLSALGGAYLLNKRRKGNE